MKIKLVKDAKVNLAVGTVVDVSPAVANFLMSVGSAVAAKEEPPKKGKKK